MAVASEKVAASEKVTNKKRSPPPMQEDYVVRPLDVNQLKEFLFPASSADNEKVVSPVFSFFSKPDQVDKGHKLVHLAKLFRQYHAEHAKAKKDKKAVEESIKREQRAFQENEDQLRRNWSNHYKRKLNEKGRRILKEHQKDIKESLVKLEREGLVGSSAHLIFKAAELALVKAEIVPILLDHQADLAVVDLSLLNELRGKLQKCTNTMASELRQKFNVQQAIVEKEKEKDEELKALRRKFGVTEEKEAQLEIEARDKKNKEKAVKAAKKLARAKEKIKSATLDQLQRDLRSQKPKLAAAFNAVQKVSEMLEGMYEIGRAHV